MHGRCYDWSPIYQKPGSFQKAYNWYEYKIDRVANAGQRRKELGLIMSKLRIRPPVPHTGCSQGVSDTMDYVEFISHLMTSQLAERTIHLWPVLENRSRSYQDVKEQGHNTTRVIWQGDENRYFNDPPLFKRNRYCIRDNRLHFMVYFRSWTYGQDSHPTWRLYNFWGVYGQWDRVEDEKYRYKQGLHLYSIRGTWPNHRQIGYD
jgi:hypothetical protein